MEKEELKPNAVKVFVLMEQQLLPENRLSVVHLTVPSVISNVQMRALDMISNE